MNPDWWSPEWRKKNLTGSQIKTRLNGVVGTTNLVLFQRVTWLSASKIIAILLAVQIVLCPYLCTLGCLFKSSSFPAACCEACATSRSANCDVPGNSIPDSPDNCPCDNCFCQGALPTKEIFEASPFAQMIWHSIEWVRLEVRQPVALTAQMESTSFAFLNAISGNDSRAALSCWII